MRRQEFQSDEHTLVSRILDRALIAHLGFLRDGAVEVLPYNFLHQDGVVYLHCSPETGLALAVGSTVKLLAYDLTAWIPSTWRHPNLACPATTYYSSLTLAGILQAVSTTTEKAVALEGFMRKYQPEDPYRPLGDKVYEGPLQALTVVKLPVVNPVVKNKMGQHLTTKQRRKVCDGLLQRARKGDRNVLQAMSQANADLGDPWVHDLDDAQLDSLTALLSKSYWALGRSRAEQARLNGDSEVVVAKVDGTRVLAFARVTWSSPGLAYLADVIVAPDQRGKGLGKELLTKVMQYPRVRETRTVMLATKDAQSLYEKFGFVERFVDDASFMTRVL